MFALQCILISLLCAISGNSFPLGGGSLGWYTLGRPLIGGALCGLILGDVQAGVTLGIAVQLVFLAVVTPGGAIGVDLSFMSYPVMAIAILSNMDTGSTISLASAIGVLGTFTFQIITFIAALYGPKVKQSLEEHNYPLFVRRFWVFKQAVYMLIRFVPSFIAIYFGSKYVAGFMQMLPVFVTNAMNILGGVLPAIGIAVLLTMSVRNNFFIIFFIVGFICVVFMNVNIIALTFIAAGIAYLFYIANSSNNMDEGQEASTFEEEEEVL